LPLGNRNGTFYCKDTLTGSGTSLETKDRSEAELLAVHKAEAAKNPEINRKIGMAYLSSADPKLAWADEESRVGGASLELPFQCSLELHATYPAVSAARASSRAPVFSRK
jgi:hypothetical protein